MTRKRIIAPDFWDDSDLGAEHSDLRLLYVGIWNASDDEGRLLYDIKRLHRLVFGYRKSVSIKRVELLVAQLIDPLKKLVPYTVNGTNYLFCKNLLKHQTISHPTPSKLPPPPENSGKLQSPPENSPQSNITKSKLNKVRKGKERNKHSLSDEDFIKALKNNLAYKHIDIDIELARMDAWFLTPKGRGRQKTRRFIVNWLNRIDKPLMPEKKRSMVGRGGDPRSTVEILKEKGLLK